MQNTVPHAAYDAAAPTLTPRIAAELIAHEGVVAEAYRDSVGIWTWSVGLTDACGHKVGRYRDNPQPLSRCFEIFIWALKENYLPPVLAAFGHHDPAEHELAGALSFHWNTGAIGRAEWMRLFRSGQAGAAHEAMMNWAKPASLALRRRRERALFFEGRWTGDGTALVYDVAKPAYRPTRGRRTDIMDALRAAMAIAPNVIGARAGAPSDRCEGSAPASNWFTRLSGIDG